MESSGKVDFDFGLGEGAKRYLLYINTKDASVFDVPYGTIVPGEVIREESHVMKWHDVDTTFDSYEEAVEALTSVRGQLPEDREYRVKMKRLGIRVVTWIVQEGIREESDGTQDRHGTVPNPRGIRGPRSPGPDNGDDTPPGTPG
jgi:hypothetical protein